MQQAFHELGADKKNVLRYLLQPEAHVYAFAIAANVLLSFYPFMLVMLAICRRLLHWPAAELAVYVAIRDYFPGETGRFLAYNLNIDALNGRSMEWLSILLLLFTANGVFLPLEVALNRAWGAAKSRSLLMNQVVSMGLIFGCGALALLSGALTGAGQVVWSTLTGESLSTIMAQLTAYKVVHPVPIPIAALFKIASAPLTIIILFLVYWLLPNVKVPWRQVLPRAIVIGLLLETLKWVNLFIWPWVYAKFHREFGVFVNSVTILTWSFLAALVVLAGADWSARRIRVGQTGSPAASLGIGDRIGEDTLPQAEPVQTQQSRGQSVWPNPRT
jgi:membrane protein